MSETILITGSNRGIGLELTHQYARAGWRVLASCRTPDSAVQLQQLQHQFSNISLHSLDIGNPKQITALAQELRNQPIDILMNNAGIYGPTDVRFGHTDEERWLECFRINSIAPLKVMEAFVEHVSASQRKTIACLSSKMGSMGDNGSGGGYIYRSSKAALNAALKSASIDLAPRNIKVAILHPGWVRTDMGGPNAEITVEQCAARLRNTLDTIDLNSSGQFIDIDGSLIPW